MFAFAGGMGRAERAAVALFLMVALGVYVWAAHYRLDVLDEGYFAYTSSRVLAGELPYRDFATPYTPGFFYLNSLLFKVFGMDLVTLRVSLVIARLAIFLLLYVLARRIMPPAFAGLPIFITLAEDTAPNVWESHPVWWAALGMLVAVWCVCRYREQGGQAWWLAAGLAAGASYAFKQNVGIFALAALVGVILVEMGELPAPSSLPWLATLAARLPAKLSDWAVRLTGPIYLLALCLGTTWVMRPHLGRLPFVMFALPFGALALDRLWAARHPLLSLNNGERLAASGVRLALVAAGFLAVTLPWLLALVLALGPAETPFGAFVGVIDTGGYYLPLEALREELRPTLGLVLVGPALVWMFFRSWPWRLKLGLSVVAAAFARWCVQELLRTAPETDPRLFRAAVLLTVKATTNVILYLPSIAFWSGLALLAGRRAPDATSFNLRWFLLAGSLLLLNQYPRTDETHVTFSGLLLWVVGAYALWRLFDLLSRQFRGALAPLGRRALYIALLGLPLAAIWPNLEARRTDLLHRQQGGLMTLATPGYVPVGLPGADVLEMDILLYRYHILAQYFEGETKPGDRIFVYPAAPLLYYLLERPNATRFNHLFPGLLSPAEEQETIERLASVPATHVIWDSFGSDYWVEAVQKGAYQRLTDYIWEAYEEVDDFGGYIVLRRKAP